MLRPPGALPLPMAQPAPTPDLGSRTATNASTLPSCFFTTSNTSSCGRSQSPPYPSPCCLQSTVQEGFFGSVAQHIMSNCKRPLAIVRPPEQPWEQVEAEPEHAQQQQEEEGGEGMAADAPQLPPPPKEGLHLHDD